MLSCAQTRKTRNQQAKKEGEHRKQNRESVALITRQGTSIWE